MRPLVSASELTASSKCAADIISTVEFDHTGNYLATGDKGGRVVLFERNEQVCSGTARPATHPSWSILYMLTFSSEKDMRVQVSYRVPVSRARV